MAAFEIEINSGPLTSEDNEVLFTDDWGYITVEVSGDPIDQFARPLVMLCFIPQNGRGKGKLTRIPRERVVRISGS
jgi:hypothetical protein